MQKSINTLQLQNKGQKTHDHFNRKSTWQNLMPIYD